MNTEKNLAVANDKKTDYKPIVIRKEHKYFIWFWKIFYSFMGFLEKRIPHNILQYIKYSMLSACAGGVEVVTNTILNLSLESVRESLGQVHWIIEYVDVTNLIATLTGLILGIICNFIINRKYTFHSSGNVPRAFMFVALFYIVITPLKTLWNGLMPQFLYDAMGVAGANIFINICGMLLIGICEFCYQKFFVYKKEENSAIDNSNKN